LIGLYTETLDDIINNFIDNLKKEARNYKGEKKQVLLSFTTDPYNSLNDKLDFYSEDG
jgi:hypothetical protein